MLKGKSNYIILTPESDNKNTGIGLYSITKRVEALNGHLHINDEKGFTLYIVIHKKGEEHEYRGC